MNTLWKNGNVDEAVARVHLFARADDFNLFMKDVENDEIGNFCEYGLGVDYVLPENTKEGYLRYQLSWGGPSEEIRFFYSPGIWKPYRIEFVYMDWGCGLGFNVTEENWAQWLADYFDDTGIAKDNFETENLEANRWK